MGIVARTKGLEYRDEAHKIRYEEAYKKAWLIQNQKDLSEKPELRIKSFFKSTKPVKKPQLPKQAKIVNNMLSEGKSPRQVAKSLYENIKYISSLITKYNLPTKK